MKNILLVFIYILFYNGLFSQTSKLEKALKLLAKGNYEKSKDLIIAFSNKKENSPLGYFIHHLWYLDSKNPSFNTDSSFYYLIKSIEINSWPVNSEISKKLIIDYCNDFKFCKELFNEYKENNGLLAFEIIKQNKSFDKIESYLNTYQGLNICKTVINYRDSIFFYNALKIKSTDLLENYIKKFPDSKYILESKKLLYYYTFNETKLLHTELGYLNYIQKYPKSTFIDSALNFATELNFLNAKKSNTEQAYTDHIQKYPESTFIDSALNFAIELNFLNAKKSNTEQAYAEHIQKYPKSPHIKSCLKFVEEHTFNETKLLHTELGYLNYIEKYPESTFIDSALNFATELNFLNAKKNNTEKAYNNHIQKYPKSVHIQSCLKYAEEIAFSLLKEKSETNEFKTFTDNYPNSLHIYQINEWQNKQLNLKMIRWLFNQLNKDSYYIYRLFEIYKIDEIKSLYLSIQSFNRYFKDDNYMLEDQLKKISDGNDYWNKFLDYPCNGSRRTEVDKNNRISNLGDSKSENEENENRKFVSYGYSFYNKHTSKFCFTNGESTFDCDCEGEAVVLNEKMEQINTEALTKINRTPISYVFQFTNNQNKECLFNSKNGKIISAWVDKIDFTFITEQFFPEKSSEWLLLKLHPLFIGFKLNVYKNNDSYSVISRRIVNCEGKEIIDSKLFPNPFPDGENSGSYIPYHTCEYANGFTGSGYIKFNNNNNNVGVCNKTFDTIILPAIYESINTLDEFNNLVVVEKNRNHKIFNLKTKEFFNLPQGQCDIEIRFLPGSYENQTPFFNPWENPNAIEVDRGEYCFGNRNYKYQRNIVYLINQNTSQKTSGSYIYNYKGKVIYKSNNSRSDIISASDSVLIVHDNGGQSGEKNTLIGIDGKTIWNPNRNYLMQFITDQILLYGYIDSKNVKHIGLYQIGKGVISEPVYENIEIEEGACYGIIFGKKQLIWKEDSETK
jgi:TolA-binding protein